MDRNLKIFVAIVIILLIIAMFSTFYATKFIAKSEKFYPPYAEVVNAFAANGKVYVEVKIENESYPIEILGGYVNILNTGQKENITPTNSTIFNVSFPITRNLASFSTVYVDGVIEGLMKGNKIFITFSSVVPLHILFSIDVVNFTYRDGIANILIKVSNPVNVTLIGIKYPSISNANLSEVVAGGDYFPLNISLPFGVHYINVSINFRQISGGFVYEENLSNYYYYFTGYALARIYFIPPQNATFNLYLAKEFN
ncbi:MAG: hypothetical protein ASUL_09654 [Candidatus Aramenus sulfurataquae]|uniref:Uncharacterized protein n=2 Tax=Candidatus Aramenus sulfurataquae TaxID=1326980 RepID=W7KUY6_9CREN|nr:MAG: hypothetical protein ASUL_09654 [Candidatus Aramenus sulfurataquae]MCL7344574.1 hypothetical protein [Candidatus Aramenus sulfurataquae]